MRKSRNLAVCMIGAACGLLFYCGSFYARSFLENRAAQQKYDNLRKECTGENDPDDMEIVRSVTSKKKNSGEQVLGKQDKTGDVSSQEEIRESFGISWDKLRKINDQVVGWIQIPGTDISYPVVQGEDDEYYLHHSISKEKDAFGTIFLGAGNSKDFRDSHSFLYGHNMEGNMMFANLNRYEEEEFYRQCPVFYIITPEEMYCYEIFSVEQAGEQSPGFQYGYELGSRAYEKQLELLSGNSMYQTHVKTDSSKPMVTLVTCNSRLDEYIRMTVHGILRDTWNREENTVNTSV
ncbi:MAG: class B sortase [Eubacteriales bacterium]|nr:class B sortase [Eubacteriales bacterium]